MDYKETFNGQEVYLAHHGVKGMKWGVRRYQNYDGTLTAAGRKRYLNSDGSLTKKGKEAFTDSSGLKKEGIDYYNSAGYKLKPTNVGSTAYSRVSGNGYSFFSPNVKAVGGGVESAAKKLGANARSLVDKEDEAYQNVDRHIKELSSSPEARKEALAYMKRDLVSPDMVDDEELIDLAARDVAYETAWNRQNKTEYGRKVNAYDESLNHWFDDAKAETERIMESRKDVVLAEDRSGHEYTYKDVVYSTLVESAPVYFSYMARHGTWEGALENNKNLDEFAEVIADDFRKS